MLPQLLTGVEGVQVLVVARTIKSGAQPVAEAPSRLPSCSTSWSGPTWPARSPAMTRCSSSAAPPRGASVC
jgi:hypothetical protein